MSQVKMNYTSERPTLVAEMATLGPKLLLETVRSMSGFVEQAFNTSTILQNLLTSNGGSACAVPETDCPPRCVCQISWEATQREQLQCNIKLTNSSDTQRVFTVRVTPFSGSAGLVKATPSHVTLNPGETGYSVLSYTVPENLPAGTYKTEILVAGVYEQCIGITLQVNNPQFCECHIDQGKIPVRVRAHHWYDHFQCVESCYEPVPQRKG